MRFSITGGRDVTGSAERAPFGLDQLDRSAVSDKAATYFPDPLTSEGADGRPCIPSSDAAGAKSGSFHRLSLVGPASMPGCGCRKFDQAVTNSGSRATSSMPADKPEAGSLLPSVSGAYSPWQVQRPHLEPMARRREA